MIHLLFGGAKTEPQNRKACLIYVNSLDGSYKSNFIAFLEDVICQDIPCMSSSPWIKELEENNINLSDNGEKQEAITLLIGADIAGKLFTGNVLQLSRDVTAIETKLGWTLLGKNSADNERESTTLSVLSMLVQEANASELWKLDTLGITDPIEKISKELDK